MEQVQAMTPVATRALPSSSKRAPGHRSPDDRGRKPPAVGLLCGLLLGTSAAAGPAAAGEAIPEISVDEIHRGQKGYGLSVFHGTEPERFEVEVLGVVRNMDPGLTYIMAILTGHDLETSGVISGMSGSPVYIDGRLAGAVAFSWAFPHEALAGITPISAMRQLSGLPTEAAGVQATAPAAVEPLQLLGGTLPQDYLDDLLGRLRPRVTAGASASITWTASGFSEETSSLLRRTLGSVSPSGEASMAADEGLLVAGGTVGMVLVDGDLRLAANATVTERRGEQILAFGHSFQGLGPIRAPMALAEVVGTVSSRNQSFKIANVGPVVGAFDQDRKSGIRGVIGLEAPMIPLHMTVHGNSTKEYRMRLAALPSLVPALLASTVLSALESANYSTGELGLDLDAHFELERYDGVDLRQSLDGPGAARRLAGLLGAAASLMTQNPQEQAALRQIDIEITQADRPRLARLVSAWPQRRSVRPGEVVRIYLDLLPYRGETLRRTFDVEVPADLTTDAYTIYVGDGTSVDLARATSIEPARPVNFAQTLETMRSFHTKRQLTALGVYRSSGVSAEGRILPQLPESIRALWNATPVKPRSLDAVVAREQVVDMDIPIEGIVKIDLEVRHR